VGSSTTVHPAATMPAITAIQVAFQLFFKAIVLL
jgi:hypothetical protein